MKRPTDICYRSDSTILTYTSIKFWLSNNLQVEISASNSTANTTTSISEDRARHIERECGGVLSFYLRCFIFLFYQLQFAKPLFYTAMDSDLARAAAAPIRRAFSREEAATISTGKREIVLAVEEGDQLMKVEKAQI